MIDPFITMGELIEPTGLGWFVLSGWFIPWGFLAVFFVTWYSFDDHYKTKWKYQDEAWKNYRRNRKGERSE